MMRLRVSAILRPALLPVIRKLPVGVEFIIKWVSGKWNFMPWEPCLSKVPVE
jgi:hypothetical protein